MRDRNEELADRMAEVGTGEGKSVVLASLSAYLAIVGFDVRCACYSMYLSERDGNTFNGLFDELDIDEKVRYGTFNNICEEILNKGQKNFKEEVKTMLLQKPDNFANKIASYLQLSGESDPKKKSF